MFLEKPNAGWSSFNFLNKENKIESFQISYLTDIPLLVSKRLLFAKQYQIPCTFSVDAEGIDYKIIIDEFDTYIILETEEPIQVKHFEMTLDTFLVEFHNSIIENFNKWCTWSCYIDLEDEHERITYRSEIITNLNKLKMYIKNNA